MQKKKNIFIATGSLLIILVVLGGILFLIRKDKITGKVLNDSPKYQVIYTFNDNRKVYSEFKDTKYVTKLGKSYDLSTALKDNLFNLDNMLNNIKKVDGLNDGGTKIYYLNNHIDIVKCHKINSNTNNTFIEDYYIVKDSKNIIDDLCK